ncbi:MAG: WG repeat-containing protein, partial [Bacteroidota bacterium]
MNQQNFFNRYRFNVRTDKLGGGSFGTVYKAYDTVLDKEVAIKVSEVKVMGGKEFSLMDEFRAIENLPPHPNIANYEKVFTFDMPQGVYDYAIIQYYPHGNLKDLISERKLSEPEKISIARQLLTGLAFLHQNRVVHRDLKPSNILIHIRNRDNGEEIIPKIADFGLSKIAEGGNSRFDNSFGGGTLEYSSPEQLMGRELRFNTDLWAYSVIVYELFTGKPLFAPQTQSTGSVQREKEIYDNILHADITKKLEALPNKWKKDMLACLVKEPENRAKSAAELSIITDDGQEIVVPQDIIPPSAPLNDGTIIHTAYEGQTVIAEPEANQALQQTAKKPISKPQFAPGVKPAGKKKNKTVFFAIGVGIIASAIAGWFFTQNPSGSENIKTATTKPDYTFYLNQGDSLAEANNIEGAKGAYNKALALKGGDTVVANRLSRLEIQNTVVGHDSIPKDKSFVKEQNESNLSVEEQLKKKFLYVNDVNGKAYKVYSSKVSKYGLADKNGNMLTQVKYDYMGDFSYGVATIKVNDKYGFLDTDGHEIISPKYAMAGSFKEGLAWVKLNNKYGYVNTAGKIIIPITYYSVWDVKDGLCCVAIEEYKHGYLNTAGEVVIPLKYKAAQSFQNGLGCVNYN